MTNVLFSGLLIKANDNIEYKCGKVKAELEENIDGSKSIKKIVSKE